MLFILLPLPFRIKYVLKRSYASGDKASLKIFPSLFTLQYETRRNFSLFPQGERKKTSVRAD